MARVKKKAVKTYSIEQVNLRVNGIALISYFHHPFAFSFVIVEKNYLGKKGI